MVSIVNEKVFLGDSAVGKTCLLLRFCDNSFYHDYVTTIGVDCKSKTMNVDNISFKMQVKLMMLNNILNFSYEIRVVKSAFEQ